MITVMITERSTGKITRKKTCSGLAPSTTAASSSSRGTVDMNARNSNMQNGNPYAISIKISPGIVLNSPTFCSTQMVGTTAGGTIRPARTRMLTHAPSRPGRRCQM